MSGSALAGVVEDIQALLHTTPPSSYKTRFWVQVALNSILIIICIVYVTASYIEQRRIGKRLSLFRIQRVSSGRFIVVNALLLLVLFDAVAAILMLLLRYKLYTIYYGNGTPINRLMLAVQGWSPLTLVAWAYSFGNIAAMMQLRTRDFGGPSRRAVITYNIAFFSTLILAFGTNIPFCILANTKMNALIRTSQGVLQLIQQHSTLSGSFTPSPTVLRELSLLLKTMQANHQSSLFWTRCVLAVAGTISCVTAISAAAAFWFVGFLFDFPKISLSDVNCRSATLVDGFEHQDCHQEVTFLGLGGPLSAPPPNLSLSFSSSPTSSPTSPRSNPSSRPTTKGGRSAKISLGSARPVQNVALKRLSRDLTWSVPIVLVLSVFCMVVAILTGIHLDDHSFAWQEVMYDSVSWSSIFLIFEVGAFLYNLLRYRPSSISSNITAPGLSRGGVQLHLQQPSFSDSPISRSSPRHSEPAHNIFTGLSLPSPPRAYFKPSPTFSHSTSSPTKNRFRPSFLNMRESTDGTEDSLEEMQLVSDVYGNDSDHEGHSYSTFSVSGYGINNADTSASEFEVAVATRNDEGCDWVELPKVQNNALSTERT